MCALVYEALCREVAQLHATLQQSIRREATDLEAAFSFTGRMVDAVCHACAPDAFLDAEEDSGGEGPDADAGFDYAELAEAMGSDSDEAAAAGGGGEDVDEANSDDDLGAALAGTSSESDDGRGERNDDAGPAGALLVTKVRAGGGLTGTCATLRKSPHHQVCWCHLLFGVFRMHTSC